MASCTRDVYAPGTSFSPTTALRIAEGIAAAAQHLHSRGILHGDLYAHNILNTTDGTSLLGDFGAACFFGPDDATVAQALQHLEVRAFGCLLEELLAHCTMPSNSAAFQLLSNLQQRCFHPTPTSRPLFTEIQEILANARAAIA
ncbi:protein kinase [Hymenobacter sp. AT01-02]|uniref:protein kinase n=1 Tax=Hymenobacter sp. AT01-02 TaxID=1571877 RepID=UPI000A9D7700|nr:protein kinase [Hymenobacter sp. AT01-02]